MIGLLALPLRIARAVSFIVFFVWELVAANAVVAWEVVTPHHYMRPAIVALPLRAKTDLEILLLSNLITLTPGTLTVEVSKDRSILYVHVLHLVTPQHMRTHLGRMEQRLLRVMR